MAAQDNPYSALAQFPPSPAADVPVKPRPPRPALIPWQVNPFAWLALIAIWLYRSVIPNGAKRRCIYIPTCSQFGLESVRKYGPVGGALYTFKRIRRCNGLISTGGVDLP
jgi:uncharacterized protein